MNTEKLKESLNRLLAAGRITQDQYNSVISKL